VVRQDSGQPNNRREHIAHSLKFKNREIPNGITPDGSHFTSATHSSSSSDEDRLPSLCPKRKQRVRGGRYIDGCTVCCSNWYTVTLNGEGNSVVKSFEWKPCKSQ
jgi:hypothetical protein